MINIENFSKRLQKVIDFYNLSASGFADKIGVQRSSISHILSGRNKPSLDFVMKVLKEFPDVELYWLLNGKGSFPADTKSEAKTDATENINSSAIAEDSKEIPSHRIDRIVIFYEDGSFKSFKN